MEQTEIAFESMLAARDSSQWAWWTMAASITSVLISLATLGMAYSALSTWREQEILKLKMEFKRSVLELTYSLDAMPAIWWYIHIHQAQSRLAAHPELAARVDDEAQIYFKKLALKESFNAVTKAWLMCEHLFADTEIEGLWSNFNDEFRVYIMRGGQKQNLSNILSSLTAKLKVL